MRKLLGLLIIGLIAVIGFSLLTKHSEAAAVGRLDIIKGSADIITGEREREAKTGSNVHTEDTIRVAPGGRITVILKDGSLFRLEENTEISMQELVTSDAKLKEVTIGVTEGKIWWKTKPLAPGGSLQVETPSLVATVRGTSFNVSHLKGTSEVYVSAHSVEVSLKAAPSKKLTLTKGMKIRVREGREVADFASGASLVAQHEKSEWILFNEAEDAKLDPEEAESSSSTITSAASSAVSRQIVPSAVSSARAISSKATVVSSATAVISSSVSSKAALASSSIASTAASSSIRAVKSLLLTTADDSLAVGERTQLYVTAIYMDGGKQTIRDVLWEVNPSTVGRVDKTGIFDAKAGGTADVVAVKDTVRSNTLSISVSGQAATAPASSSAYSKPAKTLLRIAVSYTKNPPPPTFAGGLPTANFTATGYYSDESTAVITSQVSWSVSGTAGGSITQAGYYTPKQQGSDTVTAVSQNIEGVATISIP
jgi:hypothetical protein